MRKGSHSKLLGKASIGASKGGLLRSSRARAAQGFRILVNWGANCCSAPSSFTQRTRVLLLALVLATIVSGIMHMQTLFSMETTAPHESCNCFYPHSNNSIDTAAHPPSDTAILYLPKPERPFHGNHWFHIGEYYISRRSIIQNLLHSAIADSAQPITHIKIIAQDSKFTRPMTKVAFSLLVLACLQHINGADTSLQGTNIQSIELYASNGAQLETATRKYSAAKDSNTNIIRMHAGTAVKFVPVAKPLFGYYANSDGEASFADYQTGASAGKHRPADAHLQQTVTPAVTPELKCVETPKKGDYLRMFVNSLRGKTYNTVSTGTGCASHCHCAVYAGALEKTPIASTDWFPTTADADILRGTALSMCGVRDTTTIEAASLQSPAHDGEEKTLHLVLYQRDQNRRFTALHKIVKELRARNASSHNRRVRWQVTVLKHSEQTSPCALIKALHQADILLTAHGFQSTGAMFMKPGAVLLEIFPYKYYRTTYTPLANKFRLHYRSIQNTAPIEGSGSVLQGVVASITTGAPSAQLLRVVSQGACMRDLRCRSYARSRDIAMPYSHMQLVLSTMDDVEGERL